MTATTPVSLLLGLGTTDVIMDLLMEPLIATFLDVMVEIANPINAQRLALADKSSIALENV